MAEQGDPTASVRRRSWVARIFAPLALVAALVAVFLIVSGSLGEDVDAPESRDGSARAERSGGGGSGSDDSEAEKTGDEDIPETYEVQSGDSFSTIADEYGLSIRKLERLNPDVDSTALATGQVLKLR